MELKLENGDCLELMEKLPDKSVDLFVCDLPYAETNCKWDIAIDMVKFWSEFKRLRKSPRTACIHFCSTKFGYQLIKSWEKGFKMDMVWKKRNKTGGLQSRNRPMRNHEMVYFFYDQAPKYNRDKYHKRIQAVPKFEEDDKNVYGNNKKENTQGTNSFETPQPASVLEEKDEFGWDKSFSDTMKKNGEKSLIGKPRFETPQPASVLEEKDPWGCKNGGDKDSPFGLKYDPPNPASVLEEKTTYGITKEECKNSINESVRYNGNNFSPPNPASVLEEGKWTEEHLNNNKAGAGTNNQSAIYSKTAIKAYNEKNGVGFSPPNPSSVLEEYVEPAEDEPWSMFESKKVFIGKRNHQTEKPLDILEFFLKYWTNDGDTILDPTMGSGSTGVACNNIGNRTFIGFEMDENIFKVAQKRCLIE